jgi:hypothetical protein
LIAKFSNLEGAVEVVVPKTLQNRSTAQLTIEGVYGGRASVKFKEREITIEQ